VAGSSHVVPTKLGGQKQWVYEGLPPFWQLRRTSLRSTGLTRKARRRWIIM